MIDRFFSNVQVRHRLSKRHNGVIDIDEVGQVLWQLHNSASLGIELDTALVRASNFDGVDSLDDTATETRAVFFPDVRVEEEIGEQNKHTAHVHDHEELAEVRCATRIATEHTDRRLDGNKDELSQLDRRQPWPPGRGKTEGRNEIMGVHKHVYTGVQKNGEVHITGILEWVN